MSRCWLAHLETRAGDASAQAAAYHADGSPAGWLTAWHRRSKSRRSARRVDARIIDSSGAPAWVSLVRPPAGAQLPFDDLAAQHARRQVLAQQPQDGVSTLLSDASHFEGAITVARRAGIARLPDDPFARIFPAQILRVDAGLFGVVVAPVGPTIERYGSAQPWPWDRYDADTS